MTKMVIWNEGNYSTYNDALNSGAVYDVPASEVTTALADGYPYSHLDDMASYFGSFKEALGEASSGYIMGVEFQVLGVRTFLEIHDLIEQLEQKQ